MVRNPCEWLPVPAREGKHALCRPAVAVEDGRGVKRRDLVFDERVVRAAQNDAVERAPRKMAGKGKRLPFRDETLHGGGEAGRGKDGEAFPFAGEESAETGALRRAGRDEDVVNRSWTLIFFGDVRDRDPYLYLDDGTAGWNKAREARLSRLKRNDPKTMAYRALDLAVLFAFYRSRNWSDFDAVDYEVIRKAEVSSPEMPKNVKKFNKSIQKELTDRLKAVRDTAKDADDRFGCT